MIGTIVDIIQSLALVLIGWVLYTRVKGEK